MFEHLPFLLHSHSYCCSPDLETHDACIQDPDRPFILALRFSTAQDSYTCWSGFGSGMRIEDCKAAHDQLLERGGGQDQLRKTVLFSREIQRPPDIHHVPIAMIGPKCSIGIDLFDPAPPGKHFTYAFFSTILKALIKECVGRSGMGGSAEYRGFKYFIVNPEADFVKGTSLSPHDPPHVPPSIPLESNPRREDRPLS